MKILLTETIDPSGIEILRKHAEVDIRTGQTPEQLKTIIRQYDALVVRSQTRVTAEVIDAGEKLQVIGRAGVGVDNINLEVATKRGILVVNSPEGNIVSTAEHTIAMLLALARRIPQAHNVLRSGVWSREFKGTQVRNKTLGVIGLGRVGTEVSEMARGLRMNVIAYDPMIAEARADKLGIKLVPFDTLLRESDFISVHVPLSPTTKGLIGEAQLKLVKPTAMVLNCARGSIVDEKALYEAVTQGRLAGAGIDVYSQEPAKESILFKSDKIITTPHIAASTVEAEASSSRDVCEQVIAVLQGNPAKSPVNAPMISREALATLGPYLQVGTMIGRIAAQLMEGQFRSINIRYQGDIATQDTYPIKVAVLAGLLETLTEERVNIVNADMIAQRRGLSVSEEKYAVCENYANMLSVKVVTTAGSTLVSGSSLRGTTHLTQVNDYWLEIEPTGGYMLFTEHKDRPGMIGILGTLIGNADVNISQMQVSRGVQRGGGAMMVICLDEPLPPETYEEVRNIPDMYKALLVKLTR